ncbi:Sorting and Assembly Machinery (SAM or TOB complex) component [Yamadazyma tenuis]|nr:Sorting and Assembly Machinery (SAM or TOB complex) component [Yamadazyma tenuis]
MGTLPILITEEQTVEGFADIASYIGEHFVLRNEFITSKQLNTSEKIQQKSLIHFVSTKLYYINQYNLFINTKNYGKYVRKLFKNYLPFPMMYNQPLKYFNSAKEEVKIIGIGENKTRFFSFGPDNAPVDDLEDDTMTPISKLHEKQMMLKNKERMSLRETKNTLKSIALLDGYLSQWEASSIGNSSQITAAEVLFLAYLSCIFHEELPDSSLTTTMKTHQNLYEWAENWTQTLEKLADYKDIVPPVGSQIPNLYNEIKYQLGFY